MGSYKVDEKSEKAIKLLTLGIILYEPSHEKTNNMHMRKQRRRSAHPRNNSCI